MSAKNIEGFLMIKRQDASIFKKRWQSKYVVLDNRDSHTFSIFPEKPLDDEFEIGAEIETKQEGESVVVERRI